MRIRLSTYIVDSSADPIERCFEVSLYLLVLTGFATLAGTGKLDLLAVAVVAPALAVRGWLLRQRRTIKFSERLTTRLTLGYAVFYFADFFFFAGGSGFAERFVTATVHLVLFSMIVKLFSVHRDRDHLYLAVLSFAMLLAAAILTVDTTFLALFSLYLLLCVSTFASFEMLRSSRSSVNHKSESPIAAMVSFVPSLSKTAAGLVIAILLAGGGIFFLLPRVSAGYLSALAPRNEMMTGFSDNVELGQIGQIKQSDQVVMHVQVFGDARPQQEILWRGVGLGLFDGRRWYNPQDVELVPSARGERGTFFPDQRRYWAEAASESVAFKDRRTLSYRVLMEPVSSQVFFVASFPSRISGDYRRMGMDSSGSLYNFEQDGMIGSYEAQSVLAEAGQRIIAGTGRSYPAEIKLRYLQLPALDGRVKQLAETISVSASSDYERAQLIEDWLKTNFGYSTYVPPGAEDDPVLHFLFVRKQGHCEYFASAMALMLRTQGIPARVVNGFRTGQLNDVTGSYIVRARDAHSWVEAYFPGYGWATFDPTPPDPAPSGGSFSRFALYIDAAREFWREWIINYDFSHQRTLGEQVAIKSRNVSERLRSWWRDRYNGLVARAADVGRSLRHAPLQWSGWLLGLLLFVAALVSARPLWRIARRKSIIRKPSKAPQAAASIWYAKLTKALARRGWPKDPSQTPEEYARTIQHPLLRDSVAAFTSHYERARFGKSVEDASKLPQLYEEIAAFIRE